MDQPSKLLQKFSQSLFADPTERERFIQALIQPTPFPPCILWCQDRPPTPPFAIEPPLPWQPIFVDRLALGEKPGRHSLHQAGSFYCLDFSSVFAASPLLGLPPAPRLVLDLCASPGGKSIFAWTALQPDRLLSNEVIGKRLAPLIANLKRCQIERTIVLNQDPQDLAIAIPATANVVIVDAPCTGQSLLAKGEKAPGCFHPVSINKNANRQKRVLANAAPIVAPGGYLLYMTCAYSREENEQVSTWFLTRFPQFQPVAVPQLSAYQSHLTEQPCYRIWPQSGQGAGAFTMLFKQTETGEQEDLSQEFLTGRRLNFLHFPKTAVE
ncbi:Fmu (Sun) domain-containing protein [Leptolyngbya sp. 'hensonii']|uniref:RsmB/NOP family class I SAM-dependent RNA methyltransferase n=1 Tax=Leptolyngbya sp. 'hensonii' TaxID=1922337 RepID=UPI00094F9689|nr:RsmB/NOP family class I SAM-dependent RNA methyltransferase [Leptolyngbya sp. 'hensonii']OLP18426.1 Fmu (Sun) domain-containing protein [Leptolyngbya sp. 'hensonii']